MAVAQSGSLARPHPHVELNDSGNQRLVVPCFTTGGEWVEDFILDEKRLMGYHDNEVFAKTDNKKIVKWYQGFTGSESYWLIGRAYWRSISSLNIVAGKMDSVGVEMIAKGILARHAKKPFIAPNTHKIIEALVAACSHDNKRS